MCIHTHTPHKTHITTKRRIDKQKQKTKYKRMHSKRIILLKMGFYPIWWYVWSVCACERTQLSYTCFENHSYLWTFTFILIIFNEMCFRVSWNGFFARGINIMSVSVINVGYVCWAFERDTKDKECERVSGWKNIKSIYISVENAYQMNSPIPYPNIFIYCMWTWPTDTKLPFRLVW